MANNGKKNKCFTLKDNGDTYTGTIKNGKVRVAKARTAPGQLMTIGVFDIATRTWHNDSSLPKNVRQKFEAAF